MDAGGERALDLSPLLLRDPEDFVMIFAEGKEADESLGTTAVTLGWRELAALIRQPVRIAMPRLMGDGGEYVVEADVSIVLPKGPVPALGRLCRHDSARDMAGGTPGRATDQD